MTPEGNARRILFVRSGGGMPGLDIHAGIWLALTSAGIKSTANSGTSAGAIVAAFDSAGWRCDQFEEFLRNHDDASIRHEHFAWKARLPWLESIHANDRIRAVLEGALPVEWSRLGKPLYAWATRLRDGASRDVASEERADFPAEAVLASMSISGFFPPVQLKDGELYVDGGTSNNLGLSPDWMTYDEVWLLVASPRPQDYTRRRGLVTNLMRNVQMLAIDQIEDAIYGLHVTMNLRGETGPLVRIVRPNVPHSGGLLHFNHDLIEQAYVNTYPIVEDILKESP